MFEPLRSRLGRPEIVSLMLIFGFHLSVPGGTAAKRIQVLRSGDPIQMDGVLDEPAWQEAQAISDFIQQEPDVDQPASEKTEAVYRSFPAPS